MDKEDHSTVLNDNYYGSNFAFLWEKISAQFDFSIYKYEKPIKIKKSFENDDENEDENDYFYEEKFINSIYKPKPNKKVIFHDSDAQKIMIIKNSILFCDIYAVKDELEPNRYFVGFNNFVEYSNIKTIGMIDYFDDTGNVKNKKLLTKELSDKDSRNGPISTYLYNQSLIFTQIHRDSGALLMGIVLLSHDDKFITTKNSFYFNKIKCIDRFKKVNPIINKRFIKFITSETNYLFDMGSVRTEIIESSKGIFTSVKEDKNHLVITSYKVSTDELDAFIDNFSAGNEYYGDGYPNNCIECGDLTFKATYTYPQGKFASCFTGLGNGYCPKCQIRFSKTEQRWECCKLSHPENYMCSNVITKNNPCNKEHSLTHKIVIHSDKEQSEKFPYKKELDLTRNNI